MPELAVLSKAPPRCGLIEDEVQRSLSKPPAKALRA